MSKKVYYILIILFIVPVVVVGFYNHPSFDDFAYSIDTYHTVSNGGNLVDILISAFNTSIDFMYSWQGLYSSAFILALQLAIFGEQFCGLTTIILLSSVLIGIIGSNLYYYSTSYEAVNELVTGEAQAYSKENYERVEKYTDKNLKEVIVSPFEHKPYLIVGADVCEITDTQNCESNAINKYYDKKVIGFIPKES